MDSLRGSSVKIGTIQSILARPLRKDDTHKSRSVDKQTSKTTKQRQDVSLSIDVADFAEDDDNSQ